MVLWLQRQAHVTSSCGRNVRLRQNSEHAPTAFWLEPWTTYESNWSSGRTARHGETRLSRVSTKAVTSAETSTEKLCQLTGIKTSGKKKKVDFQNRALRISTTHTVPHRLQVSAAVVGMSVAVHSQDVEGYTRIRAMRFFFASCEPNVDTLEHKRFLV